MIFTLFNWENVTLDLLVANNHSNVPSGKSHKVRDKCSESITLEGAPDTIYDSGVFSSHHSCFLTSKGDPKMQLLKQTMLGHKIWRGKPSLIPIYWTEHGSKDLGTQSWVLTRFLFSINESSNRNVETDSQTCEDDLSLNTSCQTIVKSHIPSSDAIFLAVPIKPEYFCVPWPAIFDWICNLTLTISMGIAATSEIQAAGGALATFFKKILMADSVSPLPA